MVISVLSVSFTPKEGRSMGNKLSINIDFLGGSNCPKSPAMEKNLDSALENIKIKKQYNFIDLASLPTNDYRRGYGTPTVLINGEDLFGMPRPKPTSAAPS